MSKLPFEQEKMLMPFPTHVSFTITNRCNLRCKMCGQWGIEGYMKNSSAGTDLPVNTWKRLVDEFAAHENSFICIRGGEPFLYPEILELTEYIKQKGLHLSFDTNGLLLKKYAADIVRLGVDNINVSIDGPGKVHDEVRGVKGAFKLIAEGVAAVQALEDGSREPIIKTLVFTISPYSYKGLAGMPAVARSLGILSIAIVPYYYFDEATGKEYEQIMKRELGCEATSVARVS